MADGICDNCGTPLQGEFCHRCGQREVDEWKSLGSIAQRFWDELISLDFKSVRSVAALVYPGHLAAEFIAGRRARYLSPLKVYFLAAALFFVVAPRITDFTFERQMALNRDGELRALVDARLAETHMSREFFAERYNANLRKIYTLAPIFSVLSGTFILRLLYRRRYPWLGPHMVFSLYYVAFMFLVSLLLHGLNETFPGTDLWFVTAMQFGIVLPFMFFALTRVYREPVGLTLRKTLALVTLTFLIDIPMNMAAARLTVALS